MGDLRSTYRFITPALRPVGYRMAVTDLRGHGDSDTTFMSDDDAATAADVLALIEELGGPAVIVGNSMGPGAAAFTAAERPDIVSGLVLIGPFVRNPDRSTFNRIMLRVAMAPAWAATSWKSYVPRLYAGRKPADFDANLAAPSRPGWTRVPAHRRRARHAAAISRSLTSSPSSGKIPRLADRTAVAVCPAGAKLVYRGVRASVRRP